MMRLYQLKSRMWFPISLPL